MIQPPASENTAETDSLVASSAAAVKFRGATEFRCDNDQRFIQELTRFQVCNKRRYRIIQLLN